MKNHITKVIEKGEEIMEELDNLSNIYGWHKDSCCGHSHHPSCPVIKLRRMLKSHLRQSQLALLQAVVEGMKTDYEIVGSQGGSGNEEQNRLNRENMLRVEGKNSYITDQISSLTTIIKELEEKK